MDVCILNVFSRIYFFYFLNNQRVCKLNQWQESYCKILSIKNFSFFSIPWLVFNDPKILQISFLFLLSHRLFYNPRSLSIFFVLFCIDHVMFTTYYPTTIIITQSIHNFLKRVFEWYFSIRYKIHKQHKKRKNMVSKKVSSFSTLFFVENYF